MPVYQLDEHAPQFPKDGSYWVAPSAVVIGRVTLDEMASVWYGSTLRGDSDDIHIGARSNIQDGCVLHVDPGFPLSVGRSCTIGHKVMLHGCTIGDNSLVGINSVILNGSVIGKNCIIGAYVLIPEGKVIPDNSLVMGVPGKVVREVDDKGVEMLAESAEIYVRNWQRHAKGLVKLSD